MPRNVEIKAKVEDVKELKKVASKLSGSEGILLVQEDTFFNVPNGRMKLREIKNTDAFAQLVYYDRADTAGPKLSDYHLTSIKQPTADLKKTLSLALGVRGVLKKKRWLYMVGQTRIHVDKVDGLGDFMELEVVLHGGQSVGEGQKIADDLMEKLGIMSDQLMTGAYLDHLLKASEKSETIEVEPMKEATEANTE